MIQVDEICRFLDDFAPPALAEEWDNVGLLVGRRGGAVKAVMTCLTVTPDSVAEAVGEGADLIVTHHPFPFHPLKRLTDETTVGRMLLDLVGNSVQVYSPHTAFDSTRHGINQRLAELLQLRDVRPLVPSVEHPSLGSGRFGRLTTETSLGELAGRLAEALNIQGLHLVGEGSRLVRSVAVACGSAGQFLTAAREVDCQLLVTGETSFHTCLEAEATGVAMLLPGHYASERFAVEALAEVLAGEYPKLRVWCSQRESDPLHWMSS